MAELDQLSLAVDDFTQRYLLCESTSATDPRSPLSSIAFTPGPPVVREPLVVTDLGHVVAHSVPDVLATFAALPHVDQTTTDRLLRWSLADRWIELAFGGSSDDEWTGSQIECCYTFADIVWMWLAVCRIHRAVMLQNAQGRLYTPRSFLHELALPQLADAFIESDASTRDRAEQEMKVYRLVGRDALR